MSRPVVYGASKMDLRPMWLRLRETEQRVIWSALWPDIEWSDDAADNAKWFWQRDHQDIASSDFVLVMPPEVGRLRGALVEAGMGIALGKRVVVVGDHLDYGSWQYHPAVIRAPTLSDALNIMIALFREPHEYGCS